SPAHRARLIDAGADPAAIDATELQEVTAPLPDWWTEKGNALYALPDATPPARLLERLATYECSDALIVLASPLPHLVSLSVENAATVFVGPDSDLMAGEVHCGEASRVILNGKAIGTHRPMLDARNGGAIVAEPDQLWAANVYIATDDMHRLEDVETGARVNPFGATITLGRHVWLGRDVTLTGHVDIGDGSIVGARSMVRGQKIPPNTAVAGMPARVIREGVTWSKNDLP
ncbi:MAG TPA: acyltransferase, partial [Aeromicrobium sp.]|nr:acyltransferase [Aeromicrobium sp.]